MTIRKIIRDLLNTLTVQPAPRVIGATIYYRGVPGTIVTFPDIGIWDVVMIQIQDRTLTVPIEEIQ